MMPQLPRDVPMVIYADAQQLDWSDEELEMLADVKPDVTGLLAGGVHFRPYGPDSLLLLWEFFHHDIEVLSGNAFFFLCILL
jgi:hypothetical protein